MKMLKVVLIALTCHLNSLYYVHGFHQPDLVSFGDAMEYFLSVPLSCSNVPNVNNVTDSFLGTFTRCTAKVSSSSPGRVFGNLAAICENEEQYLQCWDQLKQDIISNCNQTTYLPGVYAATVKSFCGNDQGNTTISNLTRSMLTISKEDQENCPEETGIHWLDNCKPSLDTMISEDLCDRQNAISKCLEKITCQNIEFGRLQLQIYSNGRAYLNNCSS
ncbi:hypothetical protein Bhyg_03853 [Pseudolycoriella hygida]|uniref:Secreted protein n=1 Tax=Pseudolycoriella hygida TaxID=35572 RepID=A0A9Q0S7V8_9DIPT|nr:hypothetical protein Bhyg_03853 [Pseudolycoriella hygida]